MARLTPKLFAGKSHGVEMLRARSVAPRLAVGEAEDAAHGMNETALPAGIARQAGMAGRVHVARDDGVTDFEARGDSVFRHAGRSAAFDRRPDFGSGQRRSHDGGHARFEHAMPHQHGMAGAIPELVIARFEILDWWNALDLAAEVIVIGADRHGDAKGEREHPPLPFGMEDGLIPLAFDRAEAIHAAHVMDRVHRSAVPIM